MQYARALLLEFGYLEEIDKVFMFKHNKWFISFPRPKRIH